MYSIGVSPLSSSPTKLHHLRYKAPTFNPTHFPPPNGFPFPHPKSKPFPLKLPKSASLQSNTSFKTLKTKVPIFLIGSCLFLSLCYSKPVLALPTPTVSSSSEEEEEMFERVLENEPENVKVMKVVLYKKMRRGETEEALKYVEKLMKLEACNVEWKLLEAFCYETLGEVSKAKRLFKNVLVEEPLLIRALHGLAMVMHKSYDSSVFDMLEEAMEVARRGNRVTEERNIQVLIGQMHIVKIFRVSLKIFQQMVNDNPRDFRPYLCQGIVYSLMERKEEAAQQFEIYWSLVPEEFPQKGFLDDVALAAQAKSRERLQNSFNTKFTRGK